MSVSRFQPLRRSRRSGSLRLLDQLESRTLLSATAAAWTLPTTTNVAPWSSVAVGGGKLYFSDGDGNIDEVTQGAGNTAVLAPHSTEGRTPGEMIYANGHIYFSDFAANTVSELLANGTVQDDYASDQGTPLNLTVDNSGGVWFTTNTVDGDLNPISRVVRIGADGSVASLDLPSSTQYASYLATDGGNGMWVVEQGSNGAGSAVAHVTISGSSLSIGAATAITTTGVQIGGIAHTATGLDFLVDSDGTTTDQLLTLTVSGGNITGQLATDLPASAQGTIPSTLKIDSTGKLWFAEIGVSKLASYDPASGTINEFNTGFMGILAQFAITEGANGPTDVWTLGTDDLGNAAIIDVSISQPVTTGFTVTSLSATGTEDVALAAGTRLARVDGPTGGYTVSIHWSDGSTSAGKVFTGTDGLQYVGLADGVTKTFASAATYSGTITISRDSVTQTAATSVTVGNALVASQNVVLTPLVGRLVIGVVATFTSAVNVNANQLTATINWGDGSSKGVILKNPLNHNQFFVFGTHNYHASGTYAVVTTIQNVALGETTTATASVKV